MSDNLQPYGTQDTAPPSEPLTREEQYLSAIAGITSSSDIPEKPLTRVEEYLDEIVKNGGGGGGGGTTDYNDLSNKPKLNNTELAGSLSLSDVGAQAELDTDQMEAVNSGITPEKLGTIETNILTLQGKTTGMSEGGTNYITVNGVKLYFGSTTPSNPSDGDWWLN